MVNRNTWTNFLSSAKNLLFCLRSIWYPMITYRSLSILGGWTCNLSHSIQLCKRLGCLISAIRNDNLLLGFVEYLTTKPSIIIITITQRTLFILIISKRLILHTTFPIYRTDIFVGICRSATNGNKGFHVSYLKHILNNSYNNCSYAMILTKYVLYHLIKWH